MGALPWGRTARSRQEAYTASAVCGLLQIVTCLLHRPQERRILKPLCIKPDADPVGMQSDSSVLGA